MIVTSPFGSKRMPPISRPGGAGQFEIVADAAAAQPAARPALRLARGKPVPVGERHRLVEQVGEVAAVIGRAVGALVRHRLGRDVVAAAQLERSIPISARRGVDQPLHVVIGLGASGAAIGADRRRVGEDAFGRSPRSAASCRRRACCADRVAGRPGPARRRWRRDCRSRSAAPRGNCRRRRAPVRRSSRGRGRGVGDEAAGALVGPFDRAAELARAHAGCRNIPA